MSKYLRCKHKITGINSISQRDWTLKPNLFYANKVILIEEGSAKLVEAIYKY